MYEYSAKVLRVVDGDTIDILWDLGHGTFVKERCRLLGVNTPESFGVKKGSEEYRKGIEAKNWLIGQICPGNTAGEVGAALSLHDNIPPVHPPEVRIVTVKLSRDGFMKMIREKKGKYGRYLITLYVGDDTESINTKLIKMGFGAEY